ncbi:MAG: hybrid sensor histidine kinase/response regulator [Kofleriaceae bacterium]
MKEWFEELDDLSRELYLVIDRNGTIGYADGRAERLMKLKAGARLQASPGSEEKLAHFLANGGTRCEIAFEVAGKPITVSLTARPREDQWLVVGHVIPEEFAAALDQVNDMVTETVDLNRQLTRSNADLRDSIAGVRALLDELQDKADQTQNDSEVKSRLVANLSHELRTPLHSILGLTELLASERDGKLVDEQAKQIRFIRSSAEDLLALVNDVLDLGRLDANQSHLRVEKFDLGELFGAMRGVLKPLLPDGSPVELFVDPPAPLQLETDRSKLAQIIRNLVSNALKFTEHGSVRVSGEQRGNRLIVKVRDTGIGIAPGDTDRIFEEYGQIDSHLQKKLKGTGLGLPLARKLAARLGGSLVVDSEVGKGSLFTLDVPIAHEEAAEMRAMVARSQQKRPDSTSILVVEDDRHTLFLYEKYLVMAGFHVMPARTIEDATVMMKKARPAAIVLDVMLEGDSSWNFLAQLKSDPETQDIPVLVVTVTNREDKARALGADEFWLKPIDQDRLLRKLRELSSPTPVARVLVIDDDDTARYIIKQHLKGTAYELFEAANGPDGVAAAREHRPNVILLDFLLGGMTAFDVIDELKADPSTRSIPVIVVTSHVLDALDQRRLLEEAEAVISKQNLSRELAINRIRDALKKHSLVQS